MPVRAGPPLSHFNGGQAAYVFAPEGAKETMVGNATRTVGPGTIMFIPRGTVHSFKNVGETVGRQLNCCLPGDQDRNFRKIDGMTKGGGFCVEAVHPVSVEFDMVFPG